MGGCPLLLGSNCNGDDKWKEKMKENEKEVKEEIEKLKREHKQYEIAKLNYEHKMELLALERRKGEELKKKEDEIDELKCKHNEELCALELRKWEELVEKQKLVNRERKHNDDLKDKLRKKECEFKDLKEELQMYVFQKSGLKYRKSYNNLVQNIQATLPSSNIIDEKVDEAPKEKFPFDEISHCVPAKDAKLYNMRLESTLGYIPDNSEFDRDNWRVVRVVCFPKVPSGDEDDIMVNTIAYYIITMAVIIR